MTVPQTDTGGQVENTKALERTLVKELGKMVPLLREKVRPHYVKRLALEAEEGRRYQVAATVY